MVLSYLTVIREFYIVYIFGVRIAQSVSDEIRLGGWGSVSGRGKIFLLSTSSRPALGPTQPPIQSVPGTFPWGKAAGD
jgi:hypothetical protein